MLSTVPKWRTLRWNLCFGKRNKSHGHRSGEYGGCGTTGIPFLVKRIHSCRWQCDGERCRDATSKCPKFLVGHNEPFFWVVQGPHYCTDRSVCQSSIRPHESPHFGQIFVRFWSARSFRKRFFFHTLMAIQNCFMAPKNLCSRYSMLSISPF